MSTLFKRLPIWALACLLCSLACLKEKFEEKDFVRAETLGVTIAGVDSVILRGQVLCIEGALRNPDPDRAYGFLLSNDLSVNPELNAPDVQQFIISKDFTSNEPFEQAVGGLSVTDAYIFRAYVSLGERVHYGIPIPFWLDETVNVEILDTIEILNDRAKFSGVLLLDFQENISNHGFVYSWVNNPPVVGQDSVIPLGPTNDDGLFSGLSGQLEFNTPFFLRAFAEVGTEIIYSTDLISFSTRDGWRKFAGIDLLLSGSSAAGGKDGIGYITACSPPCRETVESIQFSKVWTMDPLVDQNRNLESIEGPPGRDGGISFSLGDKIYFGLGFVSGQGNNYPVIFYEFDPANNTFRIIEDFGGAGRKDAVAFVIGDSVAYIGTGTDGSLLYDDFWRFQPKAASGKKWQLVQNPLPVQFNGTEISSGRSGAVAFSHLGKGYVGTGSVGTVRLRDLYQFDPEDESWQKAGTGELNFPNRMYASAFVLQGKAYIGLGVSQREVSQREVFRDLYQIDPSSGLIIATKMALPPDPEGSNSSPGFTFVFGERAYLGRPTEKEDRLENATEIWQYIPEEN